MLLDGHVISTGADGRLVAMTSDDVTALISRALRSDRVVMQPPRRSTRTSGPRT